MEDGFILNSESQGTITRLAPGEKITLTHRFLFGFGLPEVNAELDSTFLYEKIKTVALVFGPFIII